MQSPAFGKEHSYAPIHAGGYAAGKQIGRKGLGGSSRHQVEHEPEICTSCEEGEWYPGKALSADGEVTLPIYSALMRLHPEHCVQLWVSQYERGMDILESPAKGQKGN